MGFDIATPSAVNSPNFSRENVSNTNGNNSIIKLIAVTNSNVKMTFNAINDSFITLVKNTADEFRGMALVVSEIAQLLHQRGYPTLASQFSGVRNVFINTATTGYFIYDVSKYGLSNAVERIKTGENFAHSVNPPLIHKAEVKLGGSAQPIEHSCEPTCPATAESKTMGMVDLRQIAKSGTATLLLFLQKKIVKMTLSMAGGVMKGVKGAAATVKHCCKQQVFPFIKKGALRLAARFNRLPLHR